MTPRDPFEELRNSQGFSMAESTQDAHLAEIDKALASRKVLPIRRPRVPMMRWVAAAVILLGIGFPSAVVASANSLPGDLLYPIKQMVEPILLRFDHEVVARHRIEEVIELRGRDLPAEDVMRQAQTAVERLPADSPLRDQLAALDGRQGATDVPPPATRPQVPSHPPSDTVIRTDPTTAQTTDATDPPRSSTTSAPPTTARTDRTTTTLPETDR